MPSMPFDPVLAVVIPAYNEADRLPGLMQDWTPVFRATGQGYTIYLIDDGSTDNSLEWASRLNDPHLSLHKQANTGHGPAVLRGYRLASNAEWVFQIDSDHQLDTSAFRELWDKREGYDLLLGQRNEKVSSPPRRLLSQVSAGLVRVLFGKGVADANCPYRLVRGTLLKQALTGIPANSFAPNILLTAWFIRRRTRIFTMPVDQRKLQPRRSRMSAYIFKGALRSFAQTIAFRWRK